MSSAKKGILVIISGFSGSGKGTLMKNLMSQYEDFYSLSVSATTRNPRPDEQEGIDYFYVTKEKFDSMIQNNEFIEYAQYVDNYYGTPRAYVEEQLAAGKNVILEIEIQGALEVKRKLPQTRLLFVSAPSAKELKERLTGRGTEGESEVLKRLARAYEESLEIEKYDYFIINDDIEDTTQCLHNVIMNESYGKNELNQNYLVSSNLEFVNKMRNELLSISKGE